MYPSLKLAAKKHRALKVGIKRVKKFTIKMDATVIFYMFLHTYLMIVYLFSEHLLQSLVTEASSRQPINVIYSDTKLESSSRCD